MKKDKFLLNFKNKQCFLEILATEINTVVICVMKSGGGVDTLIATTAVDTEKSKWAVIIGEDTDLLILLIHFVDKKSAEWFLAKILKLNPSYRVYALHLNSWDNVYVMG